MGHISFFTAAYVGGGAEGEIIGGEDTSMSMMSRPHVQQRQRRRRPNMPSCTWSKSVSLFSATILLIFSVFAEAQETCNCSPVEYTFELSLDEVTCPEPPNSVFPGQAVDFFGPGVKAYTCNPRSNFPVQITSAQFIPLDPNISPIEGQTQTKENLDLVDGDSLTFTSPTTNPPVVGAVTLRLFGLNQDNDEVENTWTIKFTNECGMFSLVDGTEFGLVIFRNLVRPSQELCPIDDPPTPSPSPSPVGSLSQSYTYSRVFSKAGKNSKSAKDSKKGGGKSGKSRRVLRTSTSENIKNTKRREMQDDEDTPLRRRRLQS